MIHLDLHKHLSDHMEQYLGMHGCSMIRRKVRKLSNKSIKELKQEVYRKGAESKNWRSKEVLKERGQPARKTLEMWKEMPTRESQQALYSKQEADRQNSRIKSGKLLPKRAVWKLPKEAC